VIPNPLLVGCVPGTSFLGLSPLLAAQVVGGLLCLLPYEL